MPLVGVYDLSNIFFSLFSVIATFFVVSSWIFKLKCFNWSISLVPFLALHWSTVSHAEIATRCIPENNLLDSMTILLTFVDSLGFDFASVLSHCTTTYETHSFFVTYISKFMFFSVFTANNYILSQIKTFLVDLMTWFSYKWSINQRDIVG